MNIMTNIKWQKLNGNSQKGLSVTWQMSWQKVSSKDPLLPFQSLPGRSCRARLRWRSGPACWGCWWWSCSRVWWTVTAGCSPGSTHQTASGYHRRSNFQPEQINKHPWTWNLGNEETPSHLWTRYLDMLRYLDNLNVKYGWRQWARCSIFCHKLELFRILNVDILYPVIKISKYLDTLHFTCIPWILVTPGYLAA